VQPLPVLAQSVSFDLPVMAAFAVALLPIMRRGFNISRAEGVCLLVAYGGFLVWQGCR
jgi:Ca2+/Na+ antiporter